MHSFLIHLFSNSLVSNSPRNIKLQTARFRTLEELQTRDLVENDRLDELYLPMGGLGGQKPQITPKNANKLVFIKNKILLFLSLYIP